MEKRARKRLHVSNIPYELKKENLIELFSSMGPVLDCELINDKATGKFKGSAKIEYPDYYTVKAALRNLNRYEIKGRFLKLNFANSDKFPTDKSEIINEDDFSEPEEFEAKNVEKDLNEVLSGLKNDQKLFLLMELKQQCEANEEEFRNILRQDESLALSILALQKDLKLDRGQQNPNRAYFEEAAQLNQGNYNMMGGNRIMNKMGGGQTHQMPGNMGPFGQKRMTPINKGPGMQRRIMGGGGRDNMNKMGYNQGGMQPSRMNQNYMNYEEQNVNMGVGGMQGMRGPEGQPFFQGGDQRQFNPNMNQGNMNKNKMFYGTGNRMYQG